METKLEAKSLVKLFVYSNDSLQWDENNKIEIEKMIKHDPVNWGDIIKEWWHCENNPIVIQFLDLLIIMGYEVSPIWFEFEKPEKKEVVFFKQGLKRWWVDNEEDITSKLKYVTKIEKVEELLELLHSNKLWS